MSHLSLRTRLTLAFATAMCLVVTGLAVFVYRHAERSLIQAVDRGLRARAVDVANLANQVDNGLGGASSALAGQSFGQLIDPRGAVVDETRGLRGRSLLTAAQLARARGVTYFVDLARVSARVGAARALVEPIRAQDRNLVLVVGSSLSAERSGLYGLATGLMIGGPIALLLTALGGYLLAGAALRPVERMRTRAALISPESRGERLPVPATGDEIERLGATLNLMLARLERAREHERKFLADASHELRTPLALLKTEIELALDGRHSAQELLASLASAREETDRLVQLADDLLVLAQSDQGALPVRIAQINASELAGRVATRFGPRATGAGRQIEVDAPSELSLTVDPLRIEQALANLVDNSLRYGAGTVTVRITLLEAGVELCVRDEGTGIPVSLRLRAFERFARDERAGPDHGTGLGLAIVAVIACAHGGKAEVGNAGQVIMRLPCGAKLGDVRPLAGAAS